MYIGYLWKQCYKNATEILPFQKYISTCDAIIESKLNQHYGIIH